MTKAAKTTLDVVRDNNHGLKKLVKGKYIWDRLFAYVSSIPFSDHDLEGQLYRIWDCPDVPEIPLVPALLAEKRQRLQSLILTNSQHRPIVLHNSEDIREVCNLHIYDILNSYLEVRHFIFINAFLFSDLFSSYLDAVQQCLA